MAAALSEAAAAGVGCVQLREKSWQGTRAEFVERARVFVAAARDAGLLVIINDSPELAAQVSADGVHVGASDASVASARALLGRAAVVGATAPTPERALAALQAGADYIGVGPIYEAWQSKADAAPPRGLAALRVLRAEPRLDGLPIVAIGGITAARAADCVAAGADGVAAIRAILGAADVGAAARTFAAALAG